MDDSELNYCNDEDDWFPDNFNHYADNQDEYLKKAEDVEDNGNVGGEKPAKIKDFSSEFIWHRSVTDRANNSKPCSTSDVCSDDDVIFVEKVSAARKRSTEFKNADNLEDCSKVKIGSMDDNCACGKIIGIRNVSSTLKSHRIAYW